MSGLLVHEWIEATGGAENVLESFSEVFSESDILCLWDDAPGRFADRKVIQSWLSHTPLRKKKALALPFMLRAWRNIQLDKRYEWMLVSSHLFAHHVQLKDQSIPKYVYAHTPARYIWRPDLDGRGRSLGARSLSPALRSVDRRRAAEATKIAANSMFIRDRIQDVWNVDSEVIYPPVAVDTILSTDDWLSRVTDNDEYEVLANLPPSYVMGASRFVSYKRLDLVIKTGEILGIPVVLAGNGPDVQHLSDLAKAAKVPVTLVIAPSNSLLYAIMQAALAFVFPAVEDFGIMPVEAQACGTPVVTGPLGGQMETYYDGITGVTANSTSPQDLSEAVKKAIGLDPFDRHESTSRFSKLTFHNKIQRFVAN
ncbi:glycosyltransferase [Microbacterium sp. YY-01]|uniref:glycosyltransferase n=1 Tax=Microbacterium sp. YY-01 TaxID=3421634 RepID=UPI003D1748AE